VSGSLAANLSGATNTGTGIYQWTYTQPAGGTLEQLTVNVSATISSTTYTLSTFPEVVDQNTTAWTTTYAGYLTSLYNAMPAYTPAVDSAGRVTFNNSSIVSAGTVTNPVTVGGYSSGQAPPTAAQIATAVLTDTTADDLNVSGSPGKAIMSGSGAPTVAQIWSATTRTLTGTGGAIGPTAGANLAPIPFGPIVSGQTVDLSALLLANGQYATIKDTTAIEYTIYCEEQGGPVQAVPGHTGVTLSVADVLYDTLQTDAEASNWNFRLRPSQALGQPFPVPGRYLVVVTFTTATGVYYANFIGRAGWAG
jgi:hypothetical protein